MQPGSGEDIALIGKKFQWLNNSEILIINKDGIERTVDITNISDQNFYCCSVPMLDIEQLRKDNSSHFYYDISITKENQTIERLRRKYQDYFYAIVSEQTADT
jgi:hypothetical protein